jgi:hypothetical protein
MNQRELEDLKPGAAGKGDTPGGTCNLCSQNGGTMHLAADYETPTPHEGQCRVRVYEPVEADRESASFVVVLTELPDNPGMSVTNSAEEIAAAVGTANALPTSRTVFIEHYLDGARGTPDDPATFDLITFSHHDPEPVMRAGRWSVELGEPSWPALDRASVEALVGARVD